MEVSHQQLFRVDKPVAHMEPKLLIESRPERVDSSYKSVEKADKGYALNLEKQNKNPGNASSSDELAQNQTEPQILDKGNKPPLENGASAAQDQNQVRAEQAVIQQLKLRDQEVRAHEQAHASVGGVHAGSASFTYTRGPNGALYATGGEVGISTSPVAGDPQATLQKARQIQAAALAPLNLSFQDRAVAARAGQMALDALANMAAERIQSSKEAASEYIEERGTAGAARAVDIPAAAGPPKDNENTEARIENRDAKHLYHEVYVNKAGNRQNPPTGVNSQA